MRGRGVGFAKYKNLATYVAVIADVTVDAKSGAIRVPRASAAADAGLIINPNGLANQIEGGCIQSTSWTLHEQVRFDRQRVTSRDWAGYPILTFPEVPEIDVVLIIPPKRRWVRARPRRVRPPRRSPMPLPTRPAAASAICRSIPSASKP